MTGWWLRAVKPTFSILPTWSIPFLGQIYRFFIVLVVQKYFWFCSVSDLLFETTDSHTHTQTYTSYKENDPWPPTGRRTVVAFNNSTTKLNTELQKERHLHSFLLKVAFRAPVFCIRSQTNHSSNTSMLRESGIQATRCHKKTNWSSSPGLLRAQKQSNQALTETQRSTHTIPSPSSTRFYNWDSSSPFSAHPVCLLNNLLTY